MQNKASTLAILNVLICSANLMYIDYDLSLNSSSVLLLEGLIALLSPWEWTSWLVPR